MKWTKDQLEAINTTGINLTVSASAGAGKTAVLVERLIKRIIEDRVSVDKIVALTFTEAAAAEMKNRLMAELSNRYSQNPEDDYLKNQISLLPSAKISTIHSFCLSILKDYYYVLQLEPAALNNILDEAIIAKVKDEAFDYVLSTFDADKLEASLYQLSASATNIDSLKNIVLKVAETATSMPDSNAWLDNSILIYDSFDSLDDLPPLFLEKFWEYNLNVFSQFKDIVYNLDRVIDSLKDEVSIDNQQAWMKEVINKFNLIDKALKNRDYKTYKLMIEDIAAIKHKNITKQPDFKEAREDYFNILNEMLKMLYSEDVLLADLAHNKDLANSIIDMVKMYIKEYTFLISQDKGITFNDMETLTYKLLKKNNNEVAKELQKDIEDILVDEFQDTNLLQNQIIELIGRSNNIFRVGDVKQSIYRFRGAKPSLMQDLINQGSSNNHKTIFLKNNFRSKASIVEFNNHIFNKLMNVDNFTSSYSEADWVSAGSEGQNKDLLPVELHLVNTENEAYQDFEDDYNLTAHQFRAEYIASEIVRLYKEDSEPKYNKFTVLVESHKNKEYLRQAFERANIPYFIAMPDGFYDSYGVSTILAYLKLVLNPKDRIALTAILINLYGYSDNEIATLFSIHQDMIKVSNALDKSILNKINYFASNQNNLLISEIINFAMGINDFYESKISKQSRTNLDLFYESAIVYEKTNSGVYGFILNIELMQKEKTSEASSISSEDNVVNVMTIHNSKGLQFDTVFMYSKSANRYMDSTANFVVSPDFGLALKTVYTPKRIIKDNIANFLIRYYDHIEDLEEEMRKLYVALTRAQNRLYIIDTFKLSKEVDYSSFTYKDVIKSIGYTGWIKAIAQNHPSKTIDIKQVEYFEYDKLAKTKKEIRPILKGQPVLSASKKEAYVWPLQPLDLSIEEKHFEFGTMIHNLIEALPNNNWSAQLIKKLEPNISDKYVAKLMKLSQDDLFKSFNNLDVFKEYPFIAKVDNILERGIIDYLAISPSTVYIVDFKTDIVENKEVLIERYSDQLHFYKNVMSSEYLDKEVLAFIYSFDLEKFVEV